MNCFLVIDFDTSLIGIRSVDSSFSAMVRLESQDLVRIQDIQPSTQDEFAEGSILSNPIELVLATKVIQISSQDPSEKSLIINELNRAKHISGSKSESELTDSQSAANNEQRSKASIVAENKKKRKNMSMSQALTKKLSIIRHKGERPG